jgi:hemoglobin
MRTPFSFFVSVFMFVVLSLTGCAWSASAQPEGAAGSGPNLYKRLGGYDAIAAVSDDFIGRLAADKQLNRFLVGLSADSQKRLRQLIVDQLCQATGGPCIYIGRTMKTSHAGLGITESDWQLTVKHLVASLDKFKVPEKEKNEFLAIASSLKADIVEKK